MSTFAGKDNCTDIILDFIAGGAWGDELGNPIGEADGNYDAVIGHVRGLPGKVLAEMSLEEIGKLQSYLLYTERQPSTAVGRYQFIRRTLDTLTRRRKLLPSTLFTCELQDRLAVDLLIGRGYPAWWRGDLSDSEFAHNISLEWASLPDPRNYGRSHYQGVGPNHASTRLANVYKMLEKARLARPR